MGTLQLPFTRLRKTHTESLLPIRSPLAQILLLSFLLIPILVFLSWASWLTFREKPPILEQLSRLDAIENDLYSISRSLSYIESQQLKKRNPAHHHFQHLEGFRKQIRADLADIDSYPATLVAPQKNLLNLLRQTLTTHPIIMDQLAQSLSCTSLLQKSLEESRKKEMEKLRRMDLLISRIGGGLTVFLFLFLGVSLLWARDYWLSHRYLAVTEALNHSLNGIAFVDLATRRFVFANEGFLLLSGYSREELIQLEDRDLLPTGCLDPVGSFLALKGPSAGLVHQCQTEYLRKDKISIPVSVRLEESRWEGKRVLIEIVSDQSVQDALFKKNRETLAHLENILRNLGEGLIELSSSGEILSINTSGQTTLGYAPEEIVGQVISTENIFLDQDVQDAFWGSFHKALEDEVPHENDFLFFKRKNLPPIEVSTTFTPFFKNQEKEAARKNMEEEEPAPPPRGVVLLFRNVSRRKQVEKKMAESEEKYRLMVERSPDGIYILDVKTLIILDHNIGFGKMMGMGEKASLTGRSITDFATNPPKTIRENLLKLQVADGRTPYETIFIRSDGRKVPLSLNGSILSSNNGDAFLITVRDITLKYQAEAIQNLFLEIDRMLIFGESAQKIARTLTSCLLEAFPFLVVWISPNSTSTLPLNLQGISAVSEDLETSFLELLGEKETTISGGETSELFVLENQGGSQGSKYVGPFLELLRKNGVAALYSEPIIAPESVLLGSIHIGVARESELTSPLKLMIKDVSRKFALAYLQQKELSHIKLLEKAFGIAETPMFITDRMGFIEWCNPAYFSLTGLSSGEVIGKQHPYFQEVSPLDPGKDPWKRLSSGEPFIVEFKQKSPIKNYFLGEIRISPIFKDDEEIPSNLVCIETDITKEKKQKKDLQHKAYHDPLTRLPNRSLFEAQVDNRLKAAQKRKKSLALLFLDLDGFKAINDRYGHEMGDILLKALSQRLQDLLRQGDDLYRIGGDEFVILVNNSGGNLEISGISKRILSSVHEPFHLQGKVLSVGVSIGIAIYPENAANQGELLRHADLAMYNAKQTGRNRFVFFGDLSAENRND